MKDNSIVEVFKELKGLEVLAEIFNSIG